MSKRSEKSITNNQIVKIANSFNLTKRFVALILVFAFIWVSGPMQLVDSITYVNEPYETLYSEDVIQKDNLVPKYPTTTDPDFDSSLVDIDSEVISERTETSKTFRKIDGTYEIAIYDDAIHYFEDGEWLQVDNSLVDNGDILENKANKFKVKLPKYLDDNKQIKLTMGDYSIDWNVLNITSSPIEYEKTTITPNNIRKLSNINQSLMYSNVQPGVDIEYVLTGSQTKENIILNQYESDFSMTFEYKLKGLTLIQDEKGEILFVNDNNQIVFLFSDLIMYDNEFNESLILCLN
ncbi:MAG: hypothetical protein K9L64_03935 [Candidatus Izimaplasma sp.]|nr:hypothetical protein [Candidatus Izimaplasma bacterium]